MITIRDIYFLSHLSLEPCERPYSGFCEKWTKLGIDHSTCWCRQRAIMVTALQAKKKPVLSMAVRIGGGRSDTLLVYPGDDPKYLALKFCETHSLPLPRTAELVEAHIRQECASALSDG
eukprot:1879414-Pleurochrysis_carterae.AAC.2